MKGAQNTDPEGRAAVAIPLNPRKRALTEPTGDSNGGEQPGADAASSGGRASPSGFRGFVAAFVRISLKTLVPLLVIAAGYAGYKYLIATSPEPPTRPKQERAFTVTSQEVNAGDFQPKLEVFGNAVAGRQVDIRSLVSGKIIATGDDLREGGQVDDGELLIRIDPIDYRTALDELRAQLKEAQARKEELEGSLATSRQTLEYARKQLKLSRADLERAQPLARRGTVSERTVDDRQQVVLQRQQAADELENNIKVWEARIAQQAAQVQRFETAIVRAERRLDETELTAPFNAYVTEVGAQVGRLVSGNDKIATLIDRDWIEVRFTLTDEQYGRIVAKEGDVIGRAVEVRWVLGRNTFSYAARIERTGARITSSTGGVEVFARIASPTEPVPLRPGAFVEIVVPDKTYESTFKIPATALYNGNTVFAIVEGRLQERRVKVVGGMGEDLLIEGELKDGDRIMTSRISTPGSGIRVSEADAK